MRSFLMITFLFLAIAPAIFVGCAGQNSDSNKVPPANGAKGGKPGLNSETELQGPGTGGGGYGDESSMFILEKAQDELLTALKTIPEEALPPLPSKWNIKDYITAIENLRFSPKKEVVRDNRSLLFNWGTDENGTPFVEALKMYFESMSSVPVHTIQARALREYITDVQIRLLHEALHQFDIGITEASNNDAKIIAENIQSSLSDFHIDCSIESMPESYLRSQFLTDRYQIFRDYPSGKYDDYEMKR